MKIVIAKNYNAMSQLAASVVMQEIKRKPSLVLGLPTGHTPEGMYNELIKAYRKKIVDFQKITTFNLDEYLGIKPEDKCSYHAYMRKHFFNKVDVRPDKIHLPNEVARDLKKECLAYESLIKKNPIDLLVLGIGHDGHIGFNEPGSNFKSKTRVVRLSVATRKANSIYFTSLKKTPKSAITMGLDTIMKAKKILLLANGSDKANIINKALKNKPTKNIPASVLQKHKKLIVIIDKEAGRLLK